MFFQQAAIADFDGIWEMIQRVRADSDKRGIRQWDENYPNPKMIMGDIECGYTRMIYVDELCVGFFTTNNICEDDVHEHIIWNSPSETSLTLHRLCIDVPYQNRGYGTLFMEKYENLAKKLRYKSIRIDVFSTNQQAIHIYERFGYRRLGFAFCDRGKFFIYEKLL